MIRLYELHKCPEKYVGDIEVSGWIKTARESKNVGFIELGDGSAFRSVQVVYEHGEIPESVSKFFATGTAITVKGVLELTPEAKQSFEIKANEVIIEGECPNDYPLQKKRHSMEYLRIGLITRPHGVHGALKVQPLSEDLTRYKGLREAYLERGGAYEIHYCKAYAAAKQHCPVRPAAPEYFDRAVKLRTERIYKQKLQKASLRSYCLQFIRKKP